MPVRDGDEGGMDMGREKRRDENAYHSELQEYYSKEITKIYILLE